MPVRLRGIYNLIVLKICNIVFKAKQYKIRVLQIPKISLGTSLRLLARKKVLLGISIDVVRSYWLPYLFENLLAPVEWRSIHTFTCPPLGLSRRDLEFGLKKTDEPTLLRAEGHLTVEQAHGVYSVVKAVEPSQEI